MMALDPKMGGDGRTGTTSTTSAGIGGYDAANMVAGESRPSCRATPNGPEPSCSQPPGHRNDFDPRRGMTPRSTMMAGCAVAMRSHSPPSA